MKLPSVTPNCVAWVHNKQVHVSLNKRHKVHNWVTVTCLFWTTLLPNAKGFRMYRVTIGSNSSILMSNLNFPDLLHIIDNDRPLKFGTSHILKVKFDKISGSDLKPKQTMFLGLKVHPSKVPNFKLKQVTTSNTIPMVSNIGWFLYYFFWKVNILYWS